MNIKKNSISKSAYVHFCLLLCIGGASFAQKTSFFLKDSLSQKAIENARIALNNIDVVYSDASGLIQFESKLVKRGITVERKGYYKLKIPTVNLMNCRDSLNTCVFLMSPIVLDEVVVKPVQVYTSDAGRTVIPISRILSLPQVGGEKDIIKALQYTPGVVSGNEAQSSFMVRGGGNEQNLILLDGIPVYNQGHYLNLLSIFNPATVSNVEMFKAGFSPEYGGRLSSVLSINQKEGFGERIREFSVGILTSKLTFAETFFKNRLAVIGSVRNSNLGVITLGNLVKYYSKNPSTQASATTANINDASLKITYQHKNTKLSLSYYNSQDYLFNGERSPGQNDFSKSNFTNELYSLKFFKQFNTKSTLSANVGFVSSRLNERTYKANYEKKENFTPLIAGADTIQLYSATFRLIDTTRSGNYSDVRDLTFNSNYVNQLTPYSKLTFGVNLTNKYFRPFNERELLKGSEGALHSQFEFEKEKWKASVGLRYSGFIGQNYNDFNLEPRALFSYKYSKQIKIYAAYDRMIQYCHALIPGVDFFDRMLWLPASSSLKPEKSDQFSIGLQLNDEPKKLSITADLFYKTMSNQIFYLGNVDNRNSLSQGLKETISNGVGSAYGIEIGATKTYGNFSAQAAYTFSDSKRVFSELNEGGSFPFIFNRQHNFNTNFTWNMNEKWNFSSIFVWMSGRPINLPTSQTVTNYFWPSIPLSSGFYGSVLPPTHRLDLAANYTIRKTNRKEVIWGFSVYNAYNRKNPYAAKASFLPRADGSDIVYSTLIYKHLLPIIPSVTYTTKW